MITKILFDIFCGWGKICRTNLQRHCPIMNSNTCMTTKKKKKKRERERKEKKRKEKKRRRRTVTNANNNIFLIKLYHGEVKHK